MASMTQILVSDRDSGLSDPDPDEIHTDGWMERFLLDFTDFALLGAAALLLNFPHEPLKHGQLGTGTTDPLASCTLHSKPRQRI